MRSVWETHTSNLTHMVVRAMILLGGICVLSSCSAESDNVLPNVQGDSPQPGYTLVARLAHISDAQIVDEESPARFTPADIVVASSWRPQEAYSLHVLDGTIRAINAIHARGDDIDFVVHTGDATDNNQGNEWQWFLGIMDGEVVDPLSGLDDRLADSLPDALMDPHRPFTSEGLYRQNVHGSRSSIDWYSVIGNHDRFAVGTFPIVELGNGWRVAPLPLTNLWPLFFPGILNPESHVGFGIVSPAFPGPPVILNLAKVIEPSSLRRFWDLEEIIAAHHDTLTTPKGHGFSQGADSWYSTAPTPGIRLIVLDSASPSNVIPSFPYYAGSISQQQVRFLEHELERAWDHQELVIVATHHPSQDLSSWLGTALDASRMRLLLNDYPNVLMHLAGHVHRHRVVDRGHYLEIETGSLIDYPQEGRVIEIWQDVDKNEIMLRYALFSHLDSDEDPYFNLRQHAHEMSASDAGLRQAQAQIPDDRVINEENGRHIQFSDWLSGTAQDREGTYHTRIDWSAR